LATAATLTLERPARNTRAPSAANSLATAAPIEPQRRRQLRAFHAELLRYSRHSPSFDVYTVFKTLESLRPGHIFEPDSRRSQMDRWTDIDCYNPLFLAV